MTSKHPETFYPKTPLQWRNWLAKNHNKKTSIWLIFYKKSAKVPTLTWSEAVDEALCYGWIDGTKKSIDEERSIQYFSRRKTKSAWSKINKGKVQRLFRKHAGSKAFFASLSRSVKKMILQWLILAKRPETREKRIKEIAERAAQKRRPKHLEV